MLLRHRSELHEHVCKPCDKFHVAQVQVQEVLINTLREKDKEEFQDRENLLKQNYLTVADSMKHQQEGKIKGQIENIDKTQRDIQGCGSGAAGHGVDLAQWVQQTNVRSGYNLSSHKHHIRYCIFGCSGFVCHYHLH